jgi:KDO2-lipid IV(A) lauroyltransferase
MRHRIEYWAARAALALVRVMPDRLVRASGTVLGLAFYAVDAAHRRIAYQNLAAAFPQRTDAERRIIARQAFAHFGRLLMALLKFATLTPAQMLERAEIEGEERARSAYAHGKGVIFVTGHFGFWELQALVHALRVEPVSVIGRALDNPLLNQLLENIRQRTGNSVIYRKGTLRRILRTLQAGHGIAVLIDQHIMSPEAIYVDFFERPAATTSAIAALAIRTGAPVVPVFALPLPNGRYRLIYEHPVDPPRAVGDAAIHEFTQRCTDVLEMYVRRDPHLWLWMHRRWRDVPAQAHGMFPSADLDVE